MKTILFATDFSRPAAKAANFATHLAERLDAKVVILHAIRPMLTYTPDMQTMIIDNEFERNRTQNSMNNLEKRLRKLSAGKVKFETYLKEGFVKDVITEAIETIKPTALVMGVVGQLPRGASYIGSVATDMIQSANVPLILVPAKATYRNFENIALGLDLSKVVDAIALEKIIKFLKPFNSVINIVSVANHPEDSKLKDNSLAIRSFLGKIPHTVSIVEGSNFSKKIVDFAEENKADLIVTLPKQHNFLERFFKKSNTEKLAFRSNVPILAIS